MKMDSTLINQDTKILQNIPDFQIKPTAQTIIL